MQRKNESGVFSDGTRIAYTTIRNFKWNTSTVPTAGESRKSACQRCGPCLERSA